MQKLYKKDLSEQDKNQNNAKGGNLICQRFYR